jgi:hypothetical protein
MAQVNRPVLFAFLPLVFVFYGGFVWSVLEERYDWTAVVGVAFLGAYVLLFMLALRAGRLIAPDSATVHLAGLIADLEKDPERWTTFTFRRQVIQQLEGIARSLELFPQVTRTRDAASTLEVERWGRGVAAYFRKLKLWVVWPGPFTYTDLLHELADALELAAQGRWRELPVAEAPESTPGVSRLARAGWFTLGLVLLAATGLGLAYSAELGPAATFLAPLVGVVALTALAKGGLSVQNIADSKKALDSLRADGK